MPTEWGIVNRVNSDGQIIGQWETTTASISFRDSAGTVGGTITHPVPCIIPPIKFKLNSLNGVVADTDEMISVIPTQIDLTNAFNDAGIRLPLDINNNPISGLFELSLQETQYRVKPTWSDSWFLLDRGISGRARAFYGPYYVHFWCDPIFKLTSVDKAYIYNYVWTERNIEAGTISFKTWD